MYVKKKKEKLQKYMLESLLKLEGPHPTCWETKKGSKRSGFHYQPDKRHLAGTNQFNCLHNNVSSDRKIN